MKKLIIVLNLLLVTGLAFSQDHFLIGKWDFDKIPDEMEIDEEGAKFMNQMFGDMSISFDEKNYSVVMMGRPENGSWSLIEGEVYKFDNGKEVKDDIKIRQINDNQILFSLGGDKFLQLKRSNEKAILNVESSDLAQPTSRPSRYKATVKPTQGVDTTKELLYGKWTHNGAVINEDDSDFMKEIKAEPAKHSDTELFNYTFLEDQTYVYKGPLESVVNGTWELDKENQTLVLNGDYTERLIIMKSNESELHLYRSANNFIMKFIK